MFKKFWLAWMFLITGIIISLIFTIGTYMDGHILKELSNINYDITSKYGAFFGGVVGTLFTLTGTILIFFSLYEQTKQNKKHDFESKFYEMIRIHRENANEIRTNRVEGRAAIEKIIEILRIWYLEVEDAIKKIKNSDVSDSDFNSLYHSKHQVSKYLKSIDNMEVQFLIHKLSYGYFFYTLDKYHITKNKDDIMYSINFLVTNILERNNLTSNEPSKLNSNTNFNTLLGHYFRHLFQIIKLISEEKILPEDEKYKYSKIVRALLSDYEQILLYYNSLSVMGASWIKPLKIEKSEEMCFIARFRLIKNIPYYFEYFGINPLILFKTENASWEKKGKRFFETVLETQSL